MTPTPPRKRRATLKRCLILSLFAMLFLCLFAVARAEDVTEALLERAGLDEIEALGRARADSSWGGWRGDSSPANR